MMKLVDEIMQKNFMIEYHKLAINLLLTGSWVSFQTHEMLKPFSLTFQQYNILRILRGQHPSPATVNLLIERMLDKMSNASRIVDKLVLKKLAERKLKKDDRRCVDVIITEKGLKLLEKIEARENTFELKLANLSKREAREMNELLDKLRG